MAKSITIKATLPAWLYYFYSVDDLAAVLKSGDSDRAVSMLSFTATDRSQGDNPYTHIGDAEVTVTLAPREVLASRQIEALRKALAAERAESMKRQNAIKDRISKLQALEYVEAA